jgi:hypothetical protein
MSSVSYRRWIQTEPSAIAPGKSQQACIKDLPGATALGSVIATLTPVMRTFLQDSSKL